MNLQISIYIPAFNAESTIKLCINSILTQTVRPLEILVINDASTDNTKNILLEFGSKINIIENPTNLGLSHSMNIAHNYLKTKFIAKIDADVELCSDWIELLMKKMVNEKVTLIGGKMYEKFTKNKYNLWRSKRLKQNWGEYDLSNPKFVFGCNNILDNSKVGNIEKYRTDSDYFKTNGEDIEFSNFLKKNNHKLFYCSDAVCKSNSASAAINKWIKAVVGSNAVIHGFRHGFRDRLRAVEAPVDMIDQLGGWSLRSVGQGYGDGYPLDLLHRWMDKIVIKE